MRKYNPCLKAMVDNHRDLAAKHGHSTAHLSDEQVFAVIEDTCGMSTHQESEEYFLELIACAK